MASTEVIARQGDTVDLICWRHYGKTATVTEAVYEANPGLADLGPILPHGQRVILPAIETAQPADNQIYLWE
mgnify:CR=1 FL=1